MLLLCVLQIVDDDDDAGGAGLAELARQRASALAARQQAQQAEDGEHHHHAGDVGNLMRQWKPNRAVEAEKGRSLRFSSLFCCLACRISPIVAI